LSAIIFKMFGSTPSDQGYQVAVMHLMLLNKHLKDPNKIFAGEILNLGVIPSFSVPINPLVQNSQKPLVPDSSLPITKNVNPQDSERFWVLSWLEKNSNLLSIPGGIAFGATGNLLSPANVGMVTEVSDLYAEFKSGNITKNQYNYRRTLALNRLKKNIGPMEKLLFGNNTTHQSIRIARSGGVPATSHIAKHAKKLNNLAKVSKFGGVALVGVGLTASCMQIANTTDKSEKNEIFVEAITSTSVGVLGGVIVGIFLVSNPIGWGAALVIAVGSTAISYGAGKLGRTMYDIYGNKIDIVSGMGVSKICK